MLFRQASLEPKMDYNGVGMEKSSNLLKGKYLVD